MVVLAFGSGILPCHIARELQRQTVGVARPQFQMLFQRMIVDGRELAVDDVHRMVQVPARAAREVIVLFPQRRGVVQVEVSSAVAVHILRPIRVGTRLLIVGIAHRHGVLHQFDVCVESHEACRRQADVPPDVEGVMARIFQRRVAQRDVEGIRVVADGEQLARAEGVAGGFVVQLEVFLQLLRLLHCLFALDGIGDVQVPIRQPAVHALFGAAVRVAVVADMQCRV